MLTRFVGHVLSKKDNISQKDIGFGKIDGKRVILTLVKEKDKRYTAVLSWEQKEGSDVFYEASTVILNWFRSNRLGLSVGFVPLTEKEAVEEAFEWPKHRWSGVDIKKIGAGEIDIRDIAGEDTEECDEDEDDCD